VISPFPWAQCRAPQPVVAHPLSAAPLIWASAAIAVQKRSKAATDRTRMRFSGLKR